MSALFTGKLAFATTCLSLYILLLELQCLPRAVFEMLENSNSKLIISIICTTRVIRADRRVRGYRTVANNSDKLSTNSIDQSTY
jgi:hypothetical protein